MKFSVDELKDQIPYYLTRETKEGILKALEDFPEKMNYYTSLHKGDLLQGDVWDSLDIINMETTEIKPVKGIILTNSCDISSDNPRDIPLKIVFAPIIPLDNYEHLLRNSGLGQEKVSSKLKLIKLQRVTSLFYLPKSDSLKTDHIALLDDLHSIHPNRFIGNANREKTFTLSQVGFYLFLLKLSIHFCRFQENLQRELGAKAAS